MDNRYGSYTNTQKYVLNANLKASKRFMLGKMNNCLLVVKALKTNMPFFLIQQCI